MHRSRTCPELQSTPASPGLTATDIRLRLEHNESDRFVGYNRVDSADFLGIHTCPIAAPVLWTAAEALLTAAAQDRDAAAWFDAASQVELFCNDDLSRVQLTLLCPKKTALQPVSFTRAIAALNLPQLAGAAAVQVEARTGRPLRTLAETGASGLSYRVGERILLGLARQLLPGQPLPAADTVDLVRSTVAASSPGTSLPELVCSRGFSRTASRRVTAVEANPSAASDLRVRTQQARRAAHRCRSHYARLPAVRSAAARAPRAHRAGSAARGRRRGSLHAVAAPRTATPSSTSPAIPRRWLATCARFNLIIVLPTASTRPLSSDLPCGNCSGTRAQLVTNWFGSLG